MGTPDDLGIYSVLNSPHDLILPGKRIPSQHDIAMMRRAYDDLLAGRPDDAFGRLTSVTPEGFADCPSFLMCWHYYLGLSHAQFGARSDIDESRTEYLLASDEYKRALSIAISINDSASQVILHRMLGETFHNRIRYDQGMSEYRTALTALQRFKPGSENECAGAEITLRSLIARQQFVQGNFPAALDNIHGARELRAKYGGPIMTQRDRAVEEWLEALIMRAESLRCGGDLLLLRNALRLFKSAEKRLKGNEAHQDSLRRLHIQLTETHLDLAELYRALGKPASYKTNMKYAQGYAIQASDALRITEDTSGKAMITLALLRYDRLSIQASNLPSRIRELEMGSESDDPEDSVFASLLFEVEQLAVELNDLVLIGRAATLRADVLAFKHDYAHALATYYTAIDAFEKAGARGESTHAVYGLRRALGFV